MLRKPCQANPSLKVTIELVPLTAWGQNLRSNIKWSQWDKLRKYTFEEHEGACAICGAARGYLICHEVWEYDDKRHVQRLITLRPLCAGCATA